MTTSFFLVPTVQSYKYPLVYSNDKKRNTFSKLEVRNIAKTRALPSLINSNFKATPSQGKFSLNVQINNNPIKYKIAHNLKY